MSELTPRPVVILILGAGWTSTFLMPLCNARQISHAATSRPGNPKPDTIPFEYDQNKEEPDVESLKRLPDAKTVIITFPITVKGASKRLVKAYGETRSGKDTARWVQLGTTGIWDVTPTEPVVWSDRHSPVNRNNARAAAEDELLALSPETPTTVLNLSGLWGGARSAKHIVGRVASSKDALRARGSLHMIHGEDVSRAILAVHTNFEKAAGQRWLLTDGRVHDWWDLASAWGTAYSKNAGAAPAQTQGEVRDSDAERDPEDRGPQPRWVREMMIEAGIRALPRSVEKLGKALDSGEFWSTFGIEPIMARLE